MDRGEFEAMYKGNYSFDDNSTNINLVRENWNIGVSRDIEYFTDIFTPVILLDTNLDISHFIDQMSSDKTIFVDFKMTNQKYNLYISIFAFSSKSGVYIFKQTDNNPNDSMRQFLSSESGRKFIGYNTNNVIEELRKLFGNDFSINLEDVTKTYLKQDKNISFYQTVVKYYSEPKKVINPNDIKNCGQPVLTMKHVIYIAFKVHALSLIYPKITKINSSITPNYNIIFSAKVTPNNIKGKWNVNEIYNVEFFTGIKTPVCLIKANSDLTKYINKISKDKLIFADFKFKKGRLTPEQLKTIPLISLFTFCCSSGVYIFKEDEKKPNSQIKHLLSKKSGHKFVGINIEGAMNRLHKLFGNNFKVKIEDIAETRLSPKNDPQSISELVEKYAMEPATTFDQNLKNAKWNDANLDITLVLYAAFRALSISLIYPNLPPKKAEVTQIPNPLFNTKKEQPSVPKNVGGDTISFNSDSDYESYSSIEWKINESHNIEFFKGEFITVKLLDANENHPKIFKKMSSDPLIFFDFEFIRSSKPASPPIGLFQFCCSSGCILFKQTKNTPSSEIRNFLSAESKHKFVVKGFKSQLPYLKIMFGKGFKINILDIEKTHLSPNNLSLNFEDMVNMFGGETTAHFKDRSMRNSNWNADILTKKQILYAAFDVVSIFTCYPNFPQLPISQPTQKETTEKIDIKKRFAEYIKTIKEQDLSTKEIDNFWNNSPNLLADEFNVDLDLIGQTIMNGLGSNRHHDLKCKICTKSRKFKHFDSLVNHFKSVHFKKKSDEQYNFKNLFLHFLANVKRINLDTHTCFLCNSQFNSDEELEDHCWNIHRIWIKRILGKKISGYNNKKEQNEKEKPKQEEVQDKENSEYDYDDEDENNKDAPNHNINIDENDDDDDEKTDGDDFSNDDDDESADDDDLNNDDNDYDNNYDDKVDDFEEDDNNYNNTSHNANQNQNHASYMQNDEDIEFDYDDDDEDEDGNNKNDKDKLINANQNNKNIEDEANNDDIDFEYDDDDED